VKQIVHPPDAILWAYSRLLDQVFVHLRYRALGSRPILGNQLHDLADALHNTSAILTDYGGWTDDEKFRELYLRHYDRKWAESGFGLEAFLDEKIAEFTGAAGR
jgi:hypothetical protein